MGPPPVRRSILALDARLGDGSGAGVTQTGFGRAAGGRPGAGAAISPPRVQQPRPANKDSLHTLHKRKRSAIPADMHVACMLPSLPSKPSITVSWQLEGDAAEGDPPSFIDAMKKGRVAMTVTNDACKVAGCSFSQVKVEGPDCAWSDLVRGSVVAALGSRSYSVVATSDGHVIVYSPNGRRKSSPLCVGSGIASVIQSRGEAFRGMFAVVSTAGVLRVFDAIDLRQATKIELGPILEGGRSMVDLSLSSSGSPLVSMSDSTAYVWDGRLGCWTLVLDESTCISDFYPLPNLMDHHGEVSHLQSKARSGTQTGLLGISNKTSNARYHVSRSHIEGNLAAAVAIGSTKEIEGFLKSYALVLVESNDEPRLRELTDELIGGRLTGDTVADRKLLAECVMPAIVAERRFSKLLQRCHDIMNDLTSMNE
jgi:hypothetical protein